MVKVIGQRSRSPSPKKMLFPGFSDLRKQEIKNGLWCDVMTSWYDVVTSCDIGSARGRYSNNSGWPGRYINVRFFLHACPGLQVTKGVKLENIPAHFGYTRPAQSATNPNY